MNTPEQPPTVVTTQPRSATPRTEIGTDTTIPMSALHLEMPPSPEVHTYSSISAPRARCVGPVWKRSYPEPHRRWMRMDFRQLLVKRRRIGEVNYVGRKIIRATCTNYSKYFSCVIICLMTKGNYKLSHSSFLSSIKPNNHIISLSLSPSIPKGVTSTLKTKLFIMLYLCLFISQQPPNYPSTS